MKVIKNLSQSQLFSSHLVETNGEKKVLYIFDIVQLKLYNLEKTIQYNEYVLKGIQQMKMTFPDSFLQTFTEIKDKKWFFCQEYYEKTLDKYLLQKIIHEQEALNIFSQIVESIYSLYKEDLVHRNLRPEHFAYHNGKWKLRSLVWTNQNSGILNQFTFNPQYQAPQEYQAQSDDDLDLCQILTWNLGSILLDLLSGVHFLNSQKIINKFKNKKFTLSAVGSHIKLSEVLQNHLGQMLQFNPKNRIQLQTIFQNLFFSKIVSLNFKNNKPKVNDLKVSTKNSFVTQKMLKQSNVRSSLSNSKVFDLFSGPELLKIDFELSKAQLLKSRKQQACLRQSQQIMQEEDYFEELNLVTVVQKKKGINLLSSKKNIQNDSDIKNILAIYKTMTDKSLLLFISAMKISQIPYQNQFKEEFLLLTDFSVYYAALIELNRMIKMINLNKNIFQIEEDVFQTFINTNIFVAYRYEINQIFIYKLSIFQELASQLQKLFPKNKKLLNQPQISQYIKNRNPKEKTFDDIKKPYRFIMKKAYDIISVLYNQSQNEQYCRLSLYTVFCMTIDKLYIQKDLQDNFSHFIQWNSLKSTRSLLVNSEKFLYISVSQLQNYFETAPIKTLIVHSKKILLKYFNV